MFMGRWRWLALGLITVLGLTAAWVVSPQSEGGQEGSRPSPTTTTTVVPTSAATEPTTTVVDAATVTPTDRFAVAPGGSPAVGSGSQQFSYTVEVEEGIPLDPGALASLVDATLAEPRGWTAAGDITLRRVGPNGTPTFRVRLATPATVDAHCAPLDTNGVFSCRQGEDVMVNLERWLEGAAASELPLVEYRRYVISHEVGHALGHGHVGCPGPGQPAPVMLQQTKGLQGCAPNAWPFP